MGLSERTSKVIGEKRKWRAYKARSKQLPTSYRAAVEGFERYLMHLGPGSDDVTIFQDLLDLFEQSAADETPIREVVGEDPVAFIDEFASNYAQGQWRIREQERLRRTIAAAEVPLEP